MNFKTCSYTDCAQTRNGNWLLQGESTALNPKKAAPALSENGKEVALGEGVSRILYSSGRNSKGYFKGAKVAVNASD